MKVHFYKDFQPTEDKVSLSDLQYIGKNKIKRSVLQYNGEDLYIQFPRSLCPFGVSQFSGESKPVLEISLKSLKDSDAHKLLRDKLETLYDIIVKKSVDKSNNWWDKKKSLDILKELFKSNIKQSKKEQYADTIRLQIPHNKKGECLVEVYKSDKTTTNLEYLDKMCEAIPVVHFSHVWFVGNDYGLTLKLSLIKVFKKERIQNYSFIDEDDDDEEEDDEP